MCHTSSNLWQFAGMNIAPIREEILKAGDTPGVKSPISGMSDIGDINSPSVSVPAIFYAHRCESPLKSTNQVGRFYHMTFQNGGHERGKWPGRSLGMKLKCQIAEIGVKNRPVSPHQSMAKFARDFRWRSNSLRSAYKIARCVAGLREVGN